MWAGTLLLSAVTTIPMYVIISWIDKYIGLHGQVSTLQTSTGNVGKIMWSVVVGYMFEGVSYMAFLYLTAASTLGCLLAVVALHVLGGRLRAQEESVRKEGQLID